MGISNRLPARGDVLQVYGVIVALLYGWTIVGFLWRLPAWMDILTGAQILSLLAYGYITNLIESLLVLGAVMAGTLMLPASWTRGKYVARAAASTIAGLGSLMFFAYMYVEKGDPPELVLRPEAWVTAAFLTVAAAFAAGRIRWITRALEWLGDNATIFVYLSIPLSVMALLAVAVGLVR